LRQLDSASAWAEREARRIQKAITLLRPGIPGPGGVWADIGCGDGIFTSALHSLIRPGGEIYAVDRDRYALDALARNLAESYPDAAPLGVHPIHADFTRELTLPALDGMLMANSLHFVVDKAAVLARLIRLLKLDGRLIVVEYNTSRGNPAVPYPLDDQSFLKLVAQVGLREARILSRIPSSFLGEMYSGMAQYMEAITTFVGGEAKA
jgi:ubiquinone/menaquinone biosynthesis C-methylase UbiE